MITIHKHNVALNGKTTIITNRGYSLLSVQAQRNSPFIWIETDTAQPRVEVTLWVYMTNEEQTVLGKYVGTFQLDNGDYIGHVYHMIPKQHTKTTKSDKTWLAFLEDGKEVAGFGVTKESVKKYNRLRELWIHGQLTLEQLKQRINKICQ